MSSSEGPARPANPSPDEVASRLIQQTHPVDVRQQTSEAASQQPTPTALGKRCG